MEHVHADKAPPDRARRAPVRAPAPEPLAGLHATAGNAAVASLVVQRMLLQRFTNATAATVGDIRPNRLLTQAEYDALLQDPMTLAQLIAQHEAGHTANSPFLSLTRDFNAAAQTTDTAIGGLGAIVNGAPRIGFFDVPNGFCFVAGGGDNLQALEQEVLVLLPPTRSLADYFVSMGPNIYRGSYWDRANLQG